MIQIYCRYILILVIVAALLSLLGMANFITYSKNSEDLKKGLDILSNNGPSKIAPVVGKWQDQNNVPKYLLFENVFRIKICPDDREVWDLAIKLKDSFSYEARSHLGNEMPNSVAALSPYLSVRFKSGEWVKLAGEPDRNDYYTVVRGDSSKLNGSDCVVGHIDFKIDVASANAGDTQIPSGIVMFRPQLKLIYPYAFKNG